jgi:pre-rRNA-processing protein TSR3
VSTAYPRTSKCFDDPAQGLASIEALYLARALLGDKDPSLLDGYYWRDDFLRRCAAAGW